MATDRTFELRTYRSAPGKLEALLSRFRDHTVALFAEHGLGVLGFWTAADVDDPTTGTLVYICFFDSREAAQKAWGAFRIDPRWIAAYQESEVDGKLTTSIESLFMKPTDFSPVR
ncbi:MAG TPA: NIPSNAP family protein [Acidimicrobiales bacterium]|nr:NIPSNAP family protein [Acidimicrobiales bacterium]